MKHKKLMWLVKREVIAHDIKSAMKGKGRIYSIEEAAPENHPDEKGSAGFKTKQHEPTKPQSN